MIWGPKIGKDPRADFNHSYREKMLEIALCPVFKKNKILPSCFCFLNLAQLEVIKVFLTLVHSSAFGLKIMKIIQR